MNATVEEQIANIKADMPQVYVSIQDKAKVLGKAAFAIVRRGLRGEANCFYATERGHTVGTPFNMPGEIMPLTAYNMVVFGCSHIVLWGSEAAAPSPTETPTT